MSNDTKIILASLIVCLLVVFAFIAQGEKALSPLQAEDNSVSSSLPVGTEEEKSESEAVIEEDSEESGLDIASEVILDYASDLDRHSRDRFKVIGEEYSDRFIQLELQLAQITKVSPGSFEILIPPIYELGGRDIKIELAEKLKVFGEANVGVLLQSVADQMDAILGSRDFGKTKRRIYLSKELGEAPSSLIDFQVETDGSTRMGAYAPSMLPKTIKPFYNLTFQH